MRGSTQGTGGLITVVFLVKATEETLAFLSLPTITHTAGCTQVHELYMYSLLNSKALQLNCSDIKFLITLRTCCFSLSF